MQAHLNRAGAPYGVRFAPRDRLSNSHLALEGGEFAREIGLFPDWHENAFAAYFRDGRDIGDLPTLLEIGKKTGLPSETLRDALAARRYARQVDGALQDGRRLGIRAVPAFLFPELEARIIGAQPLDVFRRLLTGHPGRTVH